MFSVGNTAPISAPSVNVMKKQRPYQPRTYTEFVIGLKNG